MGLGGFSDGTYGYLVPYSNGAYHGIAYHGKVARFTLNTFGDVQVLDLASTDSDLQGFTGGFTDRTYGYVVPLGKLRLWNAFGQGPPLHLEHIWRDGFDYHLTVTTTSIGTTISTIPAMADYDDNAQVPKKPTSGASIILHNSQSSQRCTLQATSRRVVIPREILHPGARPKVEFFWCLALHFLAMSRSEVQRHVEH